MDGMKHVIALINSNFDVAVEIIWRNLCSFVDSITIEHDFADVFERNFGINSGFTGNVLDSLRRRLSEISNSDIDTICDELELMYPIEISAYYKFAIRAVRDHWRNETSA